MQITVGYAAHLKVGEPQVVEYTEGHPIRFGDLPLEINVRDGVLTVRATDTDTLSLMPYSANAMEIRLAPREDFRSNR